MSTTDNEVRTRLTIAADAAVGSLKTARTAASGLLDQLNRIAHVAIGAAGIGGMFGLGEGVRDADRLYGSIARLQAVTGSSVESLDAMVDVLEKGGVEGEHAEQVILRMTKGLQSAEGAASLFGEQSAVIRQHFQAMGIDIKKGPQDMLVQMSAQAAKGKLQAVDLMKTFRMGPEQAAQMMYFLKQGPQEIARTMEAQKTDASRITSQSMQQYQIMIKAKRLAKDAIQDTFSIVYRTFLPALTKFFQAISAQLEKWGPTIERAMDYLTSHMSQAVRLGERLAKLYAANAVLTTLTGKGIAGNAASGAKFIAKTAGAGAAGAGQMIGAGPLIGVITAVAKAIGGLKQLAIVGAVIGAAVATIIEGVRLLYQDWQGIRTSIVNSLTSILGRLKHIGEMLWTPFKKIGEFLAKTVLVVFDKLLWVVDKILWVIEKVAWVVEKIGGAIGSVLGALESGVGWVAEKMGLAEGNTPIGQGIYKDPAALRVAASWGADVSDYATAAAQRAMSIASGAVANLDTSKMTVNQDFRGSKIEVKQEFAEGFDAGKVIVAMADRLANMGERRLQSGFAPLYGVR